MKGDDIHLDIGLKLGTLRILIKAANVAIDRMENYDGCSPAEAKQLREIRDELVKAVMTVRLDHNLL